MTMVRRRTSAKLRTFSSARLSSSGRGEPGQQRHSGAAGHHLPARYLLAGAGAAVDAVGPDERTALMHAATFDRIEGVEALLEHGARTDRTDHGGRSGVEHALAMGAARAAEGLRRATGPA